MRAAAAFLAVTCLAWYATTFVRLPSGFTTQYYRDADWKSVPRVTTIDERVSEALVRRNWPQTGERFGVRWDGYLHLNRGGVSRVSLLSDTATRLYIDDQLAIENSGSSRPRQVTIDVRLERGVHALRLESAAVAQPFPIDLQWARRDGYPLVALTGWPIAPRAPRGAEHALRIAREGVRSLLVAAWVVFYWALILIVVVVPALRAFVRHHAPHGLSTAVVALLALSALIYVRAITWGLPGPGWAADEVFPGDLLRAVDGSFYTEWWSQNPKYPPGHFYLLGLTLPPFLVWRWLDPIAFASGPALTTLLVTFRFVCAAMAVSIVLMVYLCGSYLYSARSALVAAALAALTMPMVYHAKVATIDVPFVFWFSMSLVSFVRILVDESPIDYALFAVSAALAVSTKDQALGLYGLPIVALLVLSYRRRQRHILTAAVLGVVTVALCQNLLFNPGGFLFHVRYITGPGAGPYRMFESTLEGQWRLWQAVVMLVRVSFGWPAFLLCAIGAAWSFWRPQAVHRRLWWLFLPAVSYYITFIAPIGYAYDRFLLPVFLPLALAGGFTASRIEALPRWRGPLVAGVAGVLVYSAAYAITVDAAMLRDSRYAAEDWIRANVRAGSTIGMIGPADHVPRTDGFLTQAVSPNVERLRAAAYDYIVVNVDWVGRFRPGLPEHDLYRDLREGRLGYRQVFEAAAPIRFAGLRFADRFEPFGATGFSTLTKINPVIAVFERNVR